MKILRHLRLIILIGLHGRRHLVASLKWNEQMAVMGR